MSRGVDKVQNVGLAVTSLVLHLDGVALDSDTLFAFEVHIVQNLRLHLALVECVSELQKTVGQG